MATVASSWGMEGVGPSLLDSFRYPTKAANGKLCIHEYWTTHTAAAKKYLYTVRIFSHDHSQVDIKMVDYQLYLISHFGKAKSRDGSNVKQGNLCIALFAFVCIQHLVKMLLKIHISF